MKMVNMKMSRKETEKTAPPAGVATEGPEYPYGLCLNLEREQIDKLGLGTPKAGSKMMLHAAVEVKSVTVTDEKGGKGYKSLSLQITDLALEAIGGRNNDNLAKSLYAKE
jgi:hypothetical protein